MRDTIVTVVAVLSLLLTGCAGAASLGLDRIGEESDASPPDEALTIVDARGRTVHFDGPPERVLVSGKANLMIIEAVYLFESAGERIPALPKAGQRNAQGKAFLSLLDPAFDDKPQFVWSASGEQMASLRPDVVLLKSFMADKVGKALEELGIPVVYVDFETPEQYRRDLTILGKLLDERERLEALLESYDSQQQRVTERVDDLGEEEKPTALLLQYSEKGGEVAFHVPPSSWIQTTLVERAGGRPVWKDVTHGSGWTVVSFEQIAAWNPDKIFVVNYFSSVDEVVDRLESESQWQNLTAVRQGELYAFPKDYYSWDQPDPRWILGLTWLAKKMHPVRFDDVAMEQELFTFFEEMYGLDESGVERSVLPELEGDWE